LILSFENAIGGGAPVFSENGELIVYYIDGINNWLLKWNQTQAFEANGLITYSGSGVGFLRPSQPWSFFPNIEGTYDWNTGIQWNVTIPDVPDYPDLEYGGVLGQIIESIQDDVLFSKVESFSASYHEMGYDANTGQRLWIHDTEKWTWSRAFGEGHYADFYSPSMTWTGYDVKTGNKLWETTPQGYPWGLYQGANSLIADGKLIVGVYDGYVHAYDITTGDRLWQYYSEDTTETPYGAYPFYYGPMMAGGVIFAGTSEHSPSQPLFRGLKLHAINADTGEGIWSVTGSYNLAAIADGYLLAANGYDNKIYCFGKGPSATTVAAPKTQVMQGESLVIEGTVMDQSAGQPNTPCMSDEDMSVWMEYLHMQKPAPMTAKGVDVSLDVIDANGNFRNIGTATSDMSGVYSLVWKPDIPGKYTVIATFAGSESYGSSFAQTNFYVEEAPQPTPPPDPTPAPMTDTYIAGSTVAIVAAIAVVAILLLRKK
jgi:outer membrane protein assembly factor BamB